MTTPGQLARLARLTALARRAAEGRLGAARAEAMRRQARIAELKAAISQPLESRPLRFRPEPADGMLAAAAAWRAHLDALLRRESRALAETEARIAALRADLARAFGRQRAAEGLEAEARAGARRLAVRRAEAQTVAVRRRP